MSPFSKRIQEELLVSFPDWAPFAVTETYKGSDPYFVVTVPAPPEAATDLPLRISTWDEEITIDFDHYHSHFDRWNPEEKDDRHMSALLFVEALLNETIAAASWWQGDQCKLCAQLEPGEPLKPRLGISFTRVRVRSWKGALNADSDA